jgi:carbon-monoxide dehydrogenase medium subunit
MYLPDFEIARPKTLAEALSLLSEHGSDGTFYMGGTELILVMKLGLAAPKVLIDGKGIPELRATAVRPDGIALGAGLTHTELCAHEGLKARLPSLCALERQVANVRVRNAGTLGGNLCFAEPHSDPATYLLALDAQVVLVSERGQRRVPLDDFLIGEFQTALLDGEIMTSVEVPLPTSGNPRVGWRRVAFSERPSLSVVVSLVDDACRVVVGCVGGRPVTVPAAGAVLAERGAAGVDDAARAVEESVADLDRTSSSDYHAHLAGVFLRSALDRAMAA